jgi:hypothetical protein
MIYAKLRREGYSDSSGYTLRYLVWNGELLGTYGVHYRADDTPYGASRDYHTPATPQQIEAYRKWDAYVNLPEDEQELIDNSGNEPDYAQHVHDCCYFDYAPSICDGSGIVEITDNEQRAFEIAAMMADVTR